MNEYVKMAIAFAAGSIVGVLAGGLYFKHKYEIIIEEDEEDSENKAEVAARHYSKITETMPEKVEESGVDDVAEFEHPVEESDEQDEYRDKNYYEGFEATEIRQKNRAPKLIKEEEYGSTRFLDTHELFYYIGDGVLANEDEEIIDNIEAYLGNALTKFGFYENDESVIYVRNWNLGCDFMVTKVRSSFKDVT